jgi:hypothetical protein
VQVQVTNIQPKENVNYTKGTQTTSSGVSHELRDGKYNIYESFEDFCVLLLNSIFDTPLFNFNINI